jgi:hypothetical protein
MNTTDNPFHRMQHIVMKLFTDIKIATVGAVAQTPQIGSDRRQEEARREHVFVDPILL